MDNKPDDAVQENLALREARTLCSMLRVAMNTLTVTDNAGDKFESSGVEFRRMAAWSTLRLMVNEAVQMERVWEADVRAKEESDNGRESP